MCIRDRHDTMVENNHFDCQRCSAMAVGGEELFPNCETLMLGGPFDYEEEEINACEID